MNRIKVQANNPTHYRDLLTLCDQLHADLCAKSEGRYFVAIQNPTNTMLDTFEEKGYIIYADYQYQTDAR